MPIHARQRQSQMYGRVNDARLSPICHEMPVINPWRSRRSCATTLAVPNRSRTMLTASMWLVEKRYWLREDADTREMGTALIWCRAAGQGKRFRDDVGESRRTLAVASAIRVS